MADLLEIGALADLWYDASDHGDEDGADRIAATQKAMRDAARILRRM